MSQEFADLVGRFQGGKVPAIGNDMKLRAGNQLMHFLVARHWRWFIQVTDDDDGWLLEKTPQGKGI